MSEAHYGKKIWPNYNKAVEDVADIYEPTGEFREARVGELYLAATGLVPRKYWPIKMPQIIMKRVEQEMGFQDWSWITAKEKEMNYEDKLEEIKDEWIPTGEFRAIFGTESWLGADGRVYANQESGKFGPRIILKAVPKPQKEHDIDGKMVSESTIKNALREYMG